MKIIFSVLQERPKKWSLYFSVIIFFSIFALGIYFLFGEENMKDMFLFSSNILLLILFCFSWIFSGITFFILFFIFSTKKQDEFFKVISENLEKAKKSD